MWSGTIVVSFHDSKPKSNGPLKVWNYSSLVFYESVGGIVGFSMKIEISFDRERFRGPGDMEAAKNQRKLRLGS